MSSYTYWAIELFDFKLEMFVEYKKSYDEKEIKQLLKEYQDSGPEVYYRLVKKEVFEYLV